MSSSNGTKKGVNLDEISDDAAEPITIRGVTYRVLQLDNAGWETYERLQDVVAKAKAGVAPDATVDTREIYDLAVRVLPDAPESVVRGLSAIKAALVIFTASDTLARVAATAPNAESPAEGAATSETPSSG